MDKIRFAHVIAYIAAVSGRSFSMAEVRDIEQLLTPNCIGINPTEVNNILVAMKDGKLIEAIKAYRALTGCDLKASKDAVEATIVRKDEALAQSERQKFKNLMLNNISDNLVLPESVKHYVRDYINSFY